jgi:tRNA(adenine34) deaminase
VVPFIPSKGNYHAYIMTDLRADNVDLETPDARDPLRPLAQDEHPMTRALELAKMAAEFGEVPVGAVLIDSKSGKLVAAACNATESDCDPTAHAELVAIRQAAEFLDQSRLPDCDLYVTLEPCAMCAGAISHARIRRVYYGAADVKGGAVDHGPKWFQQPTCLHRPEIYGGIQEKPASMLLKKFFKERR